MAELPWLRFILVSGTNGKTTTAHLLHHLLARSGRRALLNDSGANLESGLLTAILTRLPLRPPGGASATFILEVDEAALARLADRLRPETVILTNFCRDQLDRYGELDAMAARLGRALAGLEPPPALILNADDPGVARLGSGRAGVSYYGLDAELAGAWSPPLEHFACESCGAELAYNRIFLGHCGDWHCPSCGLARPARQAGLAGLAPDPGGEGFALRLDLGGEEIAARLPLPGLHNVYNALAAAAAAVSLGVRPAEAAAGLSSAAPCFGRGERQRLGGRELRLFLIKNPAGANAILETISPRRATDLWFAINDLTADGRDVSWLWDVDFEGFWQRNGPPGRVLVSGRRALDLAVRLRYSGLPPERIAILPRIRRGLRLAVAGAGPLYVLATYTAMLSLRERLKTAERW